MYRERPIYDYYHRKIGSVEFDDNTGNGRALDFYHRILGFYDRKLDVTMDDHHSILGHGEFLASLVMEADENN